MSSACYCTFCPCTRFTPLITSVHFSTQLGRTGQLLRCGTLREAKERIEAGSMDRGVQEHYWTQSAEGNAGAVYKPYTEGVDGERCFQCLICLCVMYFVARLFFDGIVVFLIVALSVGLVIQLLDRWSASVRPSKYSKSHLL